MSAGLLINVTGKVVSYLNPDTDCKVINWDNISPKFKKEFVYAWNTANDILKYGVGGGEDFYAVLDIIVEYINEGVIPPKVSFQTVMNQITSDSVEFIFIKECDGRTLYATGKDNSRAYSANLNEAMKVNDYDYANVMKFEGEKIQLYIKI